MATLYLKYCPRLSAQTICLYNFCFKLQKIVVHMNTKKRENLKCLDEPFEENGYFTFSSDNMLMGGISRQIFNHPKLGS